MRFGLTISNHIGNLKKPVLETNSIVITYTGSIPVLHAAWLMIIFVCNVTFGDLFKIKC